MSPTPEAREEWRALSQAFVDKLRDDPSIPPALWELLGLFNKRLTRLEVGGLPPDDTPTQPVPRGRVETVTLRPPSHFKKAGDILKRGKQR